MKNMTTKMNCRKSLLLLSASALISVTALPVQAAHAVSEMKMTMKNSMTMKMPMTAANNASSQKSETIAVAPAPTAKSAAGAGGASSSKGVLLKYQVYVGSKYSNRKVTITVSDKQIRNGAKLTVATVSVDRNGYAKFTFPAVIGPNDTVTTTLTNKQATTVAGTKVQLVDAKVANAPATTPAPVTPQAPESAAPVVTQSAAPVVTPKPAPTHTRVAIPTPTPKPTAAPVVIIQDALTPIFGSATSTNDGFTIQIANYDGAFSWSAVDDQGGSVSISSTGRVTVTNLRSSVSSRVTVTTTRTNYKTGSATSPLLTVLAAAPAAPAAPAPVFSGGGGSAPAPAPTPTPTPTSTKVTLTAIAGVTPPIAGMTPVLNISSAQYTGTVAWSPAAGTFGYGTSYTAVITLTPTTGYTLSGVGANAFTVAGGTAINSESSGVVVVHFPATQSAAPTAISLTGIAGLPAPVAGAAPVLTVNSAQYTGTVVWSPARSTFDFSTVYTATITLTPTTGYTVSGVAANSFTVAGGTATNDANSGVVVVTFPATGPSAPVIGTNTQVISSIPLRTAMRVGDADQVISASASSGLDLTYTATGACSIVAGSRVPSIQADSAGACTITISQGGNATFAPVTAASTTITILAANDVNNFILTIDPNGGTYNGSTAIVTTVISSNSQVNLQNSTLSNGAMAFQGWHQNDIGGALVTSPIRMVTDVVLVAAWA